MASNVFRAAIALAVVSTGASLSAHAAARRPHLRPFASIVDNYRHGDADAAVAELSRWTAAEVHTSAKLPATVDVWTRAAAVLLESETDIRTASPVLTAAARTRDAAAAVGALADRAQHDQDAPLNDFCRDWTLVVASYQLRWFGSLDVFGSAGLAQAGAFHNDPDILFLAGVNAELLMGPVALVGRLPFRADTRLRLPESASLSTKRGDFVGTFASEAERFYREALGTAAPRSIVGLHLGRVLYALGRDAEAEPVLGQAERDGIATHDNFISYLAALFLGQLEEDAGQSNAAAAAYSRATADDPEAPAARLALGSLWIRLGREPDGWRAMAEMFGRPVRTQPTDVDPWSLYPAAFYHQLSDRLAALRTLVRH